TRLRTSRKLKWTRRADQTSSEENRSGEQAQSLFPSLTPRKPAFLRRFCRCVREAEESSEEISAAGAENTRSFSAVDLQETGSGSSRCSFHLIIRPASRRHGCCSIRVREPKSRNRHLVEGD